MIDSVKGCGPASHPIARTAAGGEREERVAVASELRLSDSETFLKEANFPEVVNFHNLSTGAVCSLHCCQPRVVNCT